MKKKLLIFISALSLAFTGCNYVKVEDVYEQNTVKEDTSSSMFIKIETTGIWQVVYQKDTKVMYAVSYGGYNGGTFTLLVNPDGTPMLYEGDNEDD